MPSLVMCGIKLLPEVGNAFNQIPGRHWSAAQPKVRPLLQISDRPAVPKSLGMCQYDTNPHHLAP